ncbi:hypothetical protein BCR44DRAFT_1282024 [Catenaria anguillulae PL171]|uniref:Mediator of RNA polymerase II transcription subunit 4 n=1 Tax=Catenaria anguillulae PL171 TaxID=765915 RepID=A0A1Y2HXY8_9FUNG|nr:hypothetical protein BCR44DRAFT_1282024 [Catenaria anguillulae PL171]
MFKIQAQLTAAVADLQTHLSLCSLSHATLLASFAYSNKISTLVRSLHSCEQSLQLALDPAPAHLVQLDSIVAQQLDPARVLDYAFKIAGQTSAPPLPEGAPEPKPTFAPDEASMQFGVLFKLAEGIVRPASLQHKAHLTTPPSVVATGGASGAAAPEKDEPPESATGEQEENVADKVQKKEAAHASSYGGLQDEEEDMMESVLDEDGALNFDF